jgi:N-acetylmuramic acid 6-phosphate (MurNAc-6-P) etherase
MVTAKKLAGTQIFYWRFKMAEDLNEMQKIIDQMKHSDMLRITADNTHQFMQQVADHIDKLEESVATLTARIVELEAQVGNNTKAQ